MKRLFLLLVLLCFEKFLCAQTYAWTKAFTNGVFNYVRDVRNDASGNLYLAGNFQGTVDFDFGPGISNLSSQGSSDVFFNKYTSTGELVWARRLGGPGGDNISRLMFDPAGNLYLLGTFRGTVDLDPGPGVQNFTSQGGINFGDIYLIKLDPTGNTLWIKTFGGPADESPVAIAVDASGNIFFTAQLYGTADYDPGPGVYNLTSAGNTDVAIVKLDNNGNFQWAKQLGGTQADLAFSFQLDSNADIYLVGYFGGTADFDPGPGTYTLTSAGGLDAFVCKLSSAGNLLWAAKAGSTGGDRAVDLTLGADGGVNVTGFFSGTVDFDPGPATHNLSSGSEATFLWKLSANGSFLWVNQMSGTGFVEPTAVDKDASGNIYVAGTFSGTADFNPGPGVASMTAASGTLQTYITKFSPAGKLEWARQTVSANNTYGYSFKCTGEDEVVVSGTFEGTTDFDPGAGVQNSIPVAGVTNNYVWKLTKASHVEGGCYFDLNGDGIRQASEFGLPVLVKAVGQNIAFATLADTSGQYDINVDTGVYTITVPLPVYYDTVLPASRTVVMGSVRGTFDSGNHFGVHPIGAVNDLELTLQTLSIARPGRAVAYQLTYFNRGTTVLSGTVEMKFDPRVSLLSADPVESTNVANKLVWNFSGLLPLRGQTINLLFTVGTNVPAGSYLVHAAAVYPVASDSTPRNNVDTVRQLVSASLDPNDKTVLPAGDLSPSYTDGDQYVDYTVRFQNTGNDTAFTVLVRDTLSPNLDGASLVVVAASHNYRTQISNQNIEWRFDDILLPDSNRNEPGSHGFIRYRLKPKNTLVAGDVIKNKAAIYFDFNAPVITNETVNSVSDGYCAGGLFSLGSGVTGAAQAYQWQVDQGSGFYDLSDNDVYNGCHTNVLKAYTIPSSFNGFRYRCRVLRENGWMTGPAHTVKFVNRWTGSQSTAWEEPGNWSCGSLPDEFTDVTVPGDAPRQPKVNSNAVCRSITIRQNATLIITGGYKLDIKGR